MVEIKRNEKIDIIKGVLVLLMVVYHCASMTMSRVPEFLIITNKLGFLHSSFLIISGYICGCYYFPRLNIGERQVKRRLYQRAWKMFLIFLISNLILYLIIPVFDIKKMIFALEIEGGFIKNCILSMNGNFAAFEILYYFSIFFFLIGFSIKYLSNFFLLVSLIIISGFSIFSHTAFFVGCGMVGYLFGVLFVERRLEKFWNSIIKFKWLFPMLLILYITFHPNVGLFFKCYPYMKLAFVSLETFLWFISFLVIILNFFGRQLQNVIILLGNYTLFAYMFQMLIIRVVSIVCCRFSIIGFDYYFISLITTVIILFVTLISLDKLRNSHKAIDDIYCTVFK